MWTCLRNTYISVERDDLPLFVPGLRVEEVACGAGPHSPLAARALILRRVNRDEDCCGCCCLGSLA